MGMYFNPGNENFAKDKSNDIYIDKTGLIGFLNKSVGKGNNCIAVSHARRFGKSHAAGMIEAYYSRGCDSRELFKGTEIDQDSSFLQHLNQYHVIHLDVSSFWDFYKEEIIEKIVEYLCKEMRESGIKQFDENDHFSYILMSVYKETKIPFVIIIDEWDCVIRNCENKELVHRYLQFLHALFKSYESRTFLALAYITGVLPITRIRDESAMNNFREYTMLKSRPITRFFGFTEEEVRELCDEYGMDFETEKAWYDGYLIDGMHMYNPNSVVLSMRNQDYDSYWKNTSSFDMINSFITMNYAGLKDDILNMLAGEKVIVETGMFLNDLSDIRSKDDVITALIHLGYLGYDEELLSAYIPNYEVAKAFQTALRTSEWNEVAEIISRCDELLASTIKGDEGKVAEIIELAHEAYTSVLKYNDENALSCVLTMAYFTAPAYYNLIREMPAGKGFADLVFIPRANAGRRPAMVIELKWDKDAETAIQQIKEKHYAGALAGYSSRIVLAGISYDKTTKKHECVIEEMSGIAE